MTCDKKYLKEILKAFKEAYGNMSCDEDMQFEIEERKNMRNKIVKEYIYKKGGK